MVTFQSDGYTIKVKTPGSPIDCWVELHQQLIDMITLLDTTAGLTTENYYYVLKLLQELMPDSQVAETCFATH